MENIKKKAIKKKQIGFNRFKTFESHKEEFMERVLNSNYPY